LFAGFEGATAGSHQDARQRSARDQPMTGSTSDEQIDRLVKAHWLEIGLSPRDLAEVLNAVLQQSSKQDDDPDRIGAERLMRVSKALDVPVDLLRNGQSATDEPDGQTTDAARSVLSLFELRLLRAFSQLRDHRTKRLIIHLAEQIVRRQADGGDDIA
jgi:hypothetical protein